MAGGQQLVPLDRRHRHRHRRRRRTQGRTRSAGPAQGRCAARAAAAHDPHAGRRPRPARGRAEAGRGMAQGRSHARAGPDLPGRRGGDRIQLAVAEWPMAAGGHAEEGRRCRTRRQDAQVRHRIGLRGIPGRADARGTQRAPAACAVARGPGRWQREAARVRPVARHRQGSAGGAAQEGRPGATEAPPRRARGERQRRQRDGVDRRRHAGRGADPCRGQQGPLDRHGRSARRAPAATPPPDRRGLDQLGLQPVRLAAGQPHAMAAVGRVRLLAPLHGDGFGQIPRTHVGQMGSLRAAGGAGRQRFPVPVQPRLAGRL